MIIHVVRPGDSIYSISQRYGVPYTKIISDNELANPERLVTGQTIVIMTDDRQHTVTRGESLFSIARKYGVPLPDLIAANPGLSNTSRIQPGQVITIPGSARKLGTIDVNGYAFPNINMDVLQRTLPNLTYLSIFSYQVKPDGSLTTINDTPLIEAARNAKVAPMMVITNIEEGGGFSSDLAHSILTNEQVQNTLINNVISVLQEKNYYGLDIDFEYVFPEDRDDYNNFLRKVVERLRPMGYTITTALAPKTSANQPGLLYEAHDYAVHGRLADHVILMTYEWGYTYGPPQAVAPINQVRRVLAYATTAIPSEKILMGMPNYGYNWTLPYVPGSAARTVTNTGAVDLAAQVGANIQYDNTSQAPYFSYYDSQRRRHVVWFDDARSVEARLRLIHQYDLGGASYWTINRYFPQNWLVLNSLYNVNKLL
ncbi:MAG: LysM peptidoglycan-binding domain-containing protein [Bacillota bacterium]|nr:LysM peptidoglycan-binding domain-containing protein [Bacillota bacterium]